MFITDTNSPEVSSVSVVMLVGSSGVGKSFITQMIEENFPIKVKRRN